MDFGDILDQWERQNRDGSRDSGKKAPPDSSGTKRPAGPDTAARDQFSEKADPMTIWLRNNGVYDKDAEAGLSEASPARNRQRLLKKKADAAVDLHGLTRDEAWASLEAFFADSRRKGFEKVVIIHGKGTHSEGEAVLKRTVREFLERCPYAGERGYNPSASGGTGATWVLLKK
ncbi:Smr/MutS family protein [Breznakiella homolactica]|uniref:Smr/MutS family protein n=1 Tax=Breznakiella homolactica TaxID=2798577 RepID=A0A7T7XME7_9SPIR|nr:Smr/MutS family protein [Breznakiella homolactica]QQO08948.1 Smr/MutS family protein [Breznakiella homolactica]